jgi:hypothetical protein
MRFHQLTLRGMLDGSVDDVFVCKRALAAEQVRQTTSDRSTFKFSWSNRRSSNRPGEKTWNRTDRKGFVKGLRISQIEQREERGTHSLRCIAFYVEICTSFATYEFVSLSPFDHELAVCRTVRTSNDG